MLTRLKSLVIGPERQKERSTTLDLDKRSSGDRRTLQGQTPTKRRPSRKTLSLDIRGRSTQSEALPCLPEASEPLNQLERGIQLGDLVVDMSSLSSSNFDVSATTLTSQTALNKDQSLDGGSGSRDSADTKTWKEVLLRRKASVTGRFEIALFKRDKEKKLGFTVVGGSDSPVGPIGIYVRRIVEDGLAAEDGRLQEGDRIVRVNNTNLEGLTHAEAVKAFRTAKKNPIKLVVYRNILCTNSMFLIKEASSDGRKPIFKSPSPIVSNVATLTPETTTGKRDCRDRENCDENDELLQSTLGSGDGQHDNTLTDDSAFDDDNTVNDDSTVNGEDEDNDDDTLTRDHGRTFDPSESRLALTFARESSRDSGLHESEEFLSCATHGDSEETKSLRKRLQSETNPDEEQLGFDVEEHPNNCVVSEDESKREIGLSEKSVTRRPRPICNVDGFICESIDESATELNPEDDDSEDSVVMRESESGENQSAKFELDSTSAMFEQAEEHEHTPACDDSILEEARVLSFNFESSSTDLDQSLDYTKSECPHDLRSNEDRPRCKTRIVVSEALLNFLDDGDANSIAQACTRWQNHPRNTLDVGATGTSRSAPSSVSHQGEIFLGGSALLKDNFATHQGCRADRNLSGSDFASSVFNAISRQTFAPDNFVRFFPKSEFQITI